MSVQVQLLAVKDLRNGRRYQAAYGDDSISVPFTKEPGIQPHPCAIGYIPADAIEFVKPDPDKGLIEGWAGTLAWDLDFGGPSAVKIPTGKCGYTYLDRETAKSTVRSFLDYQRKQEGEK